MNGGYANYEKLASFIEEFKFSSDGKSLFSKLNSRDEKIGRLKDIYSEFVSIINFTVDGKDYELDELDELGGVASVVLISVYLESLRDLGYLVYSSWSNFLEVIENRVFPPVDFFIVSDLSYRVPGFESGLKISHYLKVCEFLQILLDVSDYAERYSERSVHNLVFLFKNRLEVPILYDESVLEEGLDGISVLTHLMTDNSQIEHKKNIFKQVLIQYCFPLTGVERLPSLLKNFGEFSSRVNENYQFFVSEFSFDDVRKEYEEKKRDYLLKIDEIFSSVYSKLMGIPVSLGLVAVRVSGIKSFTSTADFFLALAILVYALMMIALVKNQKHSLIALKNEFQSQLNRFKFSYPDQFSKIELIEVELCERSKFQERCLSAFFWVSSMLVAVVVGFYFQSVFPDVYRESLEFLKLQMKALAAWFIVYFD